MTAAARENVLSRPAKAYLAFVLTVAVALLLPSLAQLSTDTHGWIIFAIFGSAAAVAQLFPVHTPKNNAFTPAILRPVPRLFHPRF